MASTKKTAKWSDLIDLHLESQDKILKIVNQLFMKALAPSKLENKK